MSDPLAPYDFDLPDHQIARFPPPQRDGGRLLHVGLDGLADLQIPDLPSLLRPGDLLVTNDARVHRARLPARRGGAPGGGREADGARGGRVEVMLAMPLRHGTWAALLRPARRLKPGEILLCGPGTVRLGERIDSLLWEVWPEPDAATLCEAVGALPLPPYFNREASAEDAERYQTVYHQPGPLVAAAAPTAGLHFTPELLALLDSRGVSRVSVTLAVGAGTFLPLRDEQIRDGKLHLERYCVPESTWLQVEQTRARGGRIVAVGTTSARVLESARGPGEGETELFIQEGYRFSKVDLLFTNFHLPRSSLLMLVSAFGGYDRLRAAYQHAIAADYRFFSYGDAMLVEPRAG